MAITKIAGSHNFTSSKTAGTSISVAYNTYSAGTLIIAAVAIDNISTGGGDTSDITLTDNADNNYIKVGEFSNAANANAGATVGLWYSVLTNAVTNTSSITASFSSVTAKCILLSAFTIGAGSSIQVESILTSQVDGGDLDALTFSGLPNREYLFIRVAACEQEASGGSTTPNYSPLVGFNNVTTTGGGAASNMYLRDEYRILTGTGDTSDPTLGSTCDNASIFAALYEVTSNPKNYGFIIGA